MPRVNYEVADLLLPELLRLRSAGFNEKITAHADPPQEDDALSLRPNTRTSCRWSSVRGTPALAAYAESESGIIESPTTGVRARAEASWSDSGPIPYVSPC